MPLAGGTYRSQGEVRLQRTTHGSQGQVGGTSWTTDSRGSEPGSPRWSDARSGPLWPLMLDELCLIEMHKRWQGPQVAAASLTAPANAWALLTQQRVTTDARIGPIIAPDSD